MLIPFSMVLFSRGNFTMKGSVMMNKSLLLPAPEGQPTGLICWWYLCVSISPEPAIDIDGLEVRGVAALVLEVTLPTRGVD